MFSGHLLLFFLHYMAMGELISSPLDRSRISPLGPRVTPGSSMDVMVLPIQYHQTRSQLATVEGVTAFFSCCQESCTRAAHSEACFEVLALSGVENWKEVEEIQKSEDSGKLKPWPKLRMGMMVRGAEYSYCGLILRSRLAKNQTQGRWHGP